MKKSEAEAQKLDEAAIRNIVSNATNLDDYTIEQLQNMKKQVAHNKQLVKDLNTMISGKETLKKIKKMIDDIPKMAEDLLSACRKA